MSVSQILNNFVLLNEHGELAPPKDPATGLSPFGALVFAKDKGDRIFCSLTHVSETIVSAAAHCFANYQSAKPSDFYVFYYSNRTGKMEMTPLEKVEYVGDEDYDDIAFARLPRGPAKEFDVYRPRFSNSVRRSQMSGVEHVTIWSFIPLANPGMMLKPIHCVGSPNQPWTWSGEGPAEKYTSDTKRLDPKIHLFIDSCDNTTLLGNSGAAVTTDSDGALAGIFDWNLAKDKFDSDVMLFGNSRQWKKVWNGSTNEDPSQSVLDVATAFAPVLKRPDVMAVLPSALRLLP